MESHVQDTQNPRAIFSQKNLRCTKQRLDVYAALQATKRHPTADELHRMVQQTSPGTSKATVYNTLEALCEHGLCQRIVASNGVARFDADCSRHLHVVSEDGAVVDVPEELAESISDSLPIDLQEKLAGLCDCGKASHLTIQLNA